MRNHVFSKDRGNQSLEESQARTPSFLGGRRAHVGVGGSPAGGIPCSHSGYAEVLRCSHRWASACAGLTSVGAWVRPWIRDAHTSWQVVQRSLWNTFCREMIVGYSDVAVNQSTFRTCLYVRTDMGTDTQDEWESTLSSWKPRSRGSRVTTHPILSASFLPRITELGCNVS